MADSPQVRGGLISDELCVLVLCLQLKLARLSPFESETKGIKAKETSSPPHSSPSPQLAGALCPCNISQWLCPFLSRLFQRHPYLEKHIFLGSSDSLPPKQALSSRTASLLCLTQKPGSLSKVSGPLSTRPADPSPQKLVPVITWAPPPAHHPPKLRPASLGP